MNKANCPLSDELAAYSVGSVADPGRHDILDTHIETCADCQATLQTLVNVSDTLVSAVRRPTPADEFAEEPMCREALQRVAAIGRDPSFSPLGVSHAFQANEPLGQIRDYQLLAKLGEGGMGAVYKALHTQLEKVVALKVLPSGRLADSQAVNRFKREMRAVGRLDHPNIVRAMDAGEEDGVHFLVMECVEGVDLSQLVKELGPLPIADACELIRQAAVGLEEAREHGMVHRDIKPSNLILAKSRQKPVVKILDLGLALLSEAYAPDAQGLTTTGQLMGTVDYMAPEQGGDSKNVDIRADIYALGATLYKLLTGEAIYQGEQCQTPVQKMMALATQPAPPIQERRKDVPAALAAIVHRMLQKDPTQRYATPAEVAEALAPLAAGNDLAQLLRMTTSETGAAPVGDTSSVTNSWQSASVETAPSVPRPAAPKNPVEVAPLRSLPAWLPGAGIAVAILLASVLVGWAVLAKINTPNGTLIVEVDPKYRDQVEIVASRDGSDVRVGKEEGFEIRVREGEYQLKLMGGDEELQLDRNTVTVTKGKEEVVKVEWRPKHEAASNSVVQGDHKSVDPSPSEKAQPKGIDSDNVPTAPKESLLAPTVARKGLMEDLQKPFVVVRAKTGERVELSTLARAIELHSGDDVVEVYGNGPFRTGVVPVKGNLTLRAAPGFRPQFKASLQGGDFLFAVEDGNLLIEGCDFYCQPLIVGALFSGKGSAWEFRNCRILGGVGMPINYNGQRLRIVDCLISFNYGFGGGPWIELPAEKLQWEMSNCVVRAAAGELFPLGANSQWKVKLHNNTIIISGTLVTDLTSREGAQLEVEAEGNIFQLNETNGNAYAPAHVHTWKDKVRWHGKDNLYVGTHDGLAWLWDAKGEKKSYGVAGWNEFWQEDEAGSIDSPVFFPAWREPFLAQEPAALIAAFRAYLASQHHSQAVEFQSAGPDWNLVGPGEAYVRALAAQGTPVPEDQLRPKPVEGAPFVVIRQGKVAEAFDQLGAALAAAQDGDIVELRTDDSIAAAGLPGPKKPMSLTIRAGAGYLPVIEGKTPWLVPGIRLTVEGLHFHNGNLNLPGHHLTGMDCRLVRLANCSFSADSASWALPSALGDVFSFPQLQTEGATEIVNCVTPGALALYREPKSRLQIRNSVVGSLINIYPAGEEDHFLEIDHSIVTTPATFMAPNTSISGGQWDVEGPLTQPQVTLRDSIVDNSSSFLSFGNHTMKLAGWKGERNVFALGDALWYSVYGAQASPVANLANWQALWNSDAESIQIDPIVFDPRAWKLIDGTPGSKARTDGADLGADVSRIGIIQKADPDDGSTSEADATK